MNKQPGGHVALAGKKGGAFFFALIFFATFFYQEKKVDRDVHITK